MRLVIALAFAACALTISTDAFADPKAGAKPAPRLEVVARLAEVPKLGGCGVFAIYAIVRFEVVTVVAGNYKRTNLYAGVLCPELYTLGAEYRLVLEPLVVAGSNYIDQMGEPTVPRLRAVTIGKR